MLRVVVFLVNKHEKKKRIVLIWIYFLYVTLKTEDTKTLEEIKSRISRSRTIAATQTMWTNLARIRRQTKLELCLFSEKRHSIRENNLSLAYRQPSPFYRQTHAKHSLPMAASRETTRFYRRRKFKHKVFF